MEKDVAQRYGVWGEKTFMGREDTEVFRVTVLIGPDGRVARIGDEVKPETRTVGGVSSLPGGQHRGGTPLNIGRRLELDFGADASWRPQAVSNIMHAARRSGTAGFFMMVSRGQGEDDITRFRPVLG